jgi:hypothetical protein
MAAIALLGREIMGFGHHFGREELDEFLVKAKLTAIPNKSL